MVSEFGSAGPNSLLHVTLAMNFSKINAPVVPVTIASAGN
jgi:hypothetical protein